MKEANLRNDRFKHASKDAKILLLFIYIFSRPTSCLIGWLEKI